eukprot:151325-Chlamydomonas_euryale.AAC.16
MRRVACAADTMHWSRCPDAAPIRTTIAPQLVHPGKRVWPKGFHPWNHARHPHPALPGGSVSAAQRQWRCPCARTHTGGSLAARAVLAAKPCCSKHH